MTPQPQLPAAAIATQAAEAEHRATLLTIDGKGKQAKEAALAALILTAAAKMVRESGAVEAFKLLVNEDNYLEPSFDPCEEARAALAKLRAITEGKA